MLDRERETPLQHPQYVAEGLGGNPGRETGTLSAHLAQGMEQYGPEKDSFAREVINSP